MKKQLGIILLSAAMAAAFTFPSFAAVTTTTTGTGDTTATVQTVTAASIIVNGSNMGSKSYIKDGMLFYWRKTTPVTRDKKIAGIVLGSGTLLISFSLIDVILPLEGIQPMRISPAAAFVAYMMLCTLCKRYNTFSISSENQAKYIYEIVDTPIIVLDHSGNVSMVLK